MKKQPKSESSRELLRRIKEASIPHDPDFASMRTAADGQPAKTLSEFPEALKANREARPVIEKAMEIEKGKKLGKITQYADEAYKAAANLGKVAKTLPFKKVMAVLGGPIAGAISTASDAMASEDLGQGEEMEVAKMRKEAAMSKLPMEVKMKMEEMAKKPITATDFLEKDSAATKLMKDEFSSNPQKSIGEQASPDLEEMDKALNYEDYLKKKKTQMGY